MDGCPPLEDIAAFLDGTLSFKERERMTEHLARCETCYEIFAGAVHFQEESSAEDTRGRGVLPFPSREKEDRAPQRISRWYPLAASIVLATGLGFFAWRYFFATPEIRLADLIETIDVQPQAAEVRYSGNRLRGLEAETGLLWDRPLFMAGVHLIDLRLSIQSKKSESARDLLQSLGIELQTVPLTQDLGKLYEMEYLALSPGFDTAQLAPKLLEKEAALEERLSDYPPFSFGLWSEAGRLAAKVKSPEFFARRDNRRYLSYLKKILPDQFAEELQRPVRDDLQAIEHIWDQGELSPEDYQALARHFQSIIKQIDDHKEDLPSEDLRETAPQTDSGAE